MRRLVTIVMMAAAAMLTACGSRAASADSAQVAPYVSSSASASASSGGGSSPVCFTAADVKSALGFDVRSLTGGMRHYAPMWNCGYAATDSSLSGVAVSASIYPKTEADSVFNHITSAAKMAQGQNAQPDVLQVGDRGLAYASLSHSVAAAVAGDRLYIVEVMHGSSGPGFGKKKEGSIVLLRKLMGV